MLWCMDFVEKVSTYLVSFHGPNRSLPPDRRLGYLLSIKPIHWGVPLLRPVPYNILEDILQFRTATIHNDIAIR